MMHRYRIYGHKDSDRTIIALPALGERKEMYGFLAKYLKEFKIIAVDLPGHNQMKQADNSISLFILEIRNILEELNISSAHFIGNSIGGWIIQSFYSKFPDYVESLTLLDGGYYFLGEREDFEAEIQLPVFEHFEDLENAISETANTMKCLTEEGRNNFKSYLHGNFVLKENLYIHHSNEKALNTLSKEITVTDYCLKQKIEKPFLLILAEQSIDEYSKEKVHVFKNLHPNLSVNLIPDGYHFLPITNPLQVANILKETYASNVN